MIAKIKELKVITHPSQYPQALFLCAIWPSGQSQFNENAHEKGVRESRI